MVHGGLHFASSFLTGNMSLEYVTSTKGKPMLKHNGYLYFQDHCSKAGRIYWKCTEFNVCPARVITEGEAIIRSDEHDHLADSSSVAAKISYARMKEKACSTGQTVHKIIAEEIASTSDGVRACLSGKNSIKRTLHRARHCAVDSEPPVPESRSDFIVPPKYQITGSGKKFLYFDSGMDDPDRFLIFTTTTNLQALQGFHHWFADGTFKMCPSIFAQIYTIHVLVCNTVIPMVYMLLPSKSEEVYGRVLTQLKNLASGLNPYSIMTDLEMSFTNAMEHQFPDAVVRYCYFHLCQAMYRKLGELGLQARYNTDEEFSIKIRMVAALAFVPTEKVQDVFNNLVEKVFNEEDDVSVDDFLSYFERTYVGRTTGPRRRSPRFAIERWNRVQAVGEDLPLTNNRVEGWHRAFQGYFDARNPTIWSVLKAFQLDEGMALHTIASVRSGREEGRPRKKYLDVTERLKILVMRYGSDLYQSYEDGGMTYLRDVACVLKM